MEAGPLEVQKSQTTDHQFLDPGVCLFPNCQVILVLDDQSRLYACKHVLFHASQFFEKMFLAEFKEKYSKEIEIPDVSKDSLLQFLHWADKQPHQPLPSDEASISALITLADRFMCPKLQTQIFHLLNTEAMYKSLSVKSKLLVLQVADKYKASSVEILEACIRLCSNIPIHQLSAQLTGKITNGTLAALFELIAKVASDPKTITGGRSSRSSPGFTCPEWQRLGHPGQTPCANCGSDSYGIVGYKDGAYRNCCLLESRSETDHLLQTDYENIKGISINRKLLK